MAGDPHDREHRDDTERRDDTGDVGGDAACWANLVCDECGAVRGDEHRAGCSQARARPA
jgi:hypothetical protein